MSQGPNRQVNMGMLVVEVLHEGVVVIGLERLDGKGASCILDRGSIGSGRHR
jgi:hypothetical protein